ncbi:hypothetical protein J6U76_04025, partial [bacterium]|nr:hypothetical protein [bacterium]
KSPRRDAVVGNFGKKGVQQRGERRNKVEQQSEQQSDFVARNKENERATKFFCCIFCCALKLKQIRGKSA